MKTTGPMVSRRTERPDLTLFPNLFYLGPQRTGSTWLHANLSRHPEVHLHRDKETFYFSTLGHPRAPRYRYHYLEDYLNSFRERLLELSLKNYHALRRCGCFYRPRIRGDFTASYGVLGAGIIEEVMGYSPDLRGIILVRDPLERAWSHAKKDLVRGRDQPASVEQMFEFISSVDQLERADYRAAVTKWTRYLQPGHLYVAPYDRISSDPEHLLSEIEGFLGIRRLGGASRRHVTTRQNVTTGSGMPDPLKCDAETVLAPAIASCRDLLLEIGPGKTF